MEYDEQKELARKLFPFIEIKEKDCFEEIIKKLEPHRARVLKIIEGIEIPSEWAYRWARFIGDRELMRDRINESEWAYAWARFIGDRELMRDRITESEWAFEWSFYIGDKEIMDKVIAKEALQDLSDQAQELDMGY